jgi:hypothetical protein
MSYHDILKKLKIVKRCIKYLMFLFVHVGFVTFAYSNEQNVPIHYTLEKQSLPHYKPYTFQASGLPTNTRVLFTMSLIDGSSTTLPETLLIDKVGNLVHSKGKTIICELGICFGYGEQLQITLQPCDRRGKPLKNSKVRGFLEFVPNPLEISDEKGHHLSIVSLDPSGKEFLIKLKGFEPYEKVRWLSISSFEKVENEIVIDQNGECNSNYFPGVPGKEEGPFIVSFSNDNTTLTLQHYWGKIAFSHQPEYSKLKKKFPSFFRWHNSYLRK